MTGRTAGWAAALWVVALPATARAEDDPWLGKDKALHFGATAALSAAGYGVAVAFAPKRWQRATVGAAVGMGAGATKELIDLAGHGNPSWRDVTWDAIGTATGVALALTLDLALSRDDDAIADARGSALVIRF